MDYRKSASANRMQHWEAYRCRSPGRLTDMSSSRRNSLSLGVSLGLGHRCPITATTAAMFALLLLVRAFSASKETDKKTGQK